VNAPQLPSTTPGPVLLTVEEAARQLKIGRTLMFQLIRTGQIESVQIGRLRRIRPDALAAFAQRLTSAA
jgi:excisionase family DNA binding protein